MTRSATRCIWTAALGVCLGASAPAAVGPLVASVAHAGEPTIWQQAVGESEVVAAYRELMDEGDLLGRQSVEQAQLRDTGRARQLALRAAESYERAIKLRPDDPEPHYRAAELLYQHFAGTQNFIPADVAPRVIAHWLAFEKLAPADPRRRTTLFNRSLVHTKQGDHQGFVQSIEAYDKLLELVDSSTSTSEYLARILSNKAEIHMAIGDLDGAIDNYYSALDLNREHLYAYGLAVALDRDGQETKARELLTLFRFAPRELTQEGIFFVPEGDIYWYYSLGYESLGKYDAAANYMQRYLAAQPRSPYAKRAAERIKELLAKARKMPRKSKRGFIP